MLVELCSGCFGLPNLKVEIIFETKFRIHLEVFCDSGTIYEDEINNRISIIFGYILWCAPLFLLLDVINIQHFNNYRVNSKSILSTLNQCFNKFIKNLYPEAGGGGFGTSVLSSSHLKHSHLAVTILRLHNFLRMSKYNPLPTLTQILGMVRSLIE